MKRILATVLLSVVAAVGVMAETVTETLFFSKSTITVSGYSGSTTLGNFPVLVKLTAGSPVGFAYADCAAGGADIRFADADGNLIPHEIDTWNTAGTSLVWVSIPSVSGTTTEFTMYYGASDVPALPEVDAGTVWTATGHRAVWHFAADAKESAQGLVASASAGTPSYANDGAVGKCWQSAGMAWLEYANNASWSTLGEGSTLTISAWAKYDGSANYNRILSTMSVWTMPAGYELTIQNQKNQITVGSSSSSQHQKIVSPGPSDQLVYLTAVYNSDRYADLYVNGVRQEHKQLNQVIQPTEALHLACVKGTGTANNIWNGKLDEVRLHAVAESSDWVKACYDTMTSASFLSMAEVEPLSGTIPLTVRATSCTQTGTQAVIAGRLTNLGTGATEASVKLFWGTSETVDDTCASVDLGSFTDKADISTTLTGLNPAETYYHAFRATNNAATPETVWTPVQTFTVDASTKLSGTSASTVNCKVAISGTVSEWGVGTTKAELLVATSAANLAVVQTLDNLTTAPADGKIAFDPRTLAVGTYYYAIRTVTTYGANVWTNSTATNSVALSDSSTYTWKGGTGDWTNAVMWTTSDEGGVGYPTAGCSAVFGDANSDVTLTTGYTLTNLTISSVGTHAFRTPAPQTSYTLSVVSGGHITMVGNGNGTLILDSVVLNNKIETLSGLKQLVIENKGKAEAVSSPTTDIVLVNGGQLYGGAVYTSSPDLIFGKLRLVGGPNVVSFSQYTQKGVRFASFEPVEGSGVPVVSVIDGLVSFADVTGIEMIGETATLADGTSKIPVCPNFQIGSARDSQYGKQACTLDNGVVKAIPAATMMTTLVGATETDNVQLGADFTLEQDVTVNALIFNGANINLGGHTVTVKSGVFREGANGMYNRVVSNGVVRLSRPNALGDGTNNTDARCRVDFATDGNDDPGKGMIAHNCQGGGWDTHAVYTNFTGTFAPPPGLEFQISSKLRSPRAILEMRGGALKPADHLIKANLRGISGTGWTDFNGKWKALLWLGEVGEDDLESFNSKEGRIVVGNGGSICPGYVDYDGGRRGKFSISYTPPQGTLPKLDTLEFRPGSKLSVTVRRDGTCSWIDASAVASDGGSLQVVLNGMLEVESPTPVRSKDATVWTVLKSAKPTTGAFTSIQEGYKVTYNVALAHGAYAVQVTKPAVGTIICLR